MFGNLLLIDQDEIDCLSSGKEKQRGFSGTEMVIGDGWTCAQYVVEDDVVRAPAGCGVNSKKTISLQVRVSKNINF